MDINLLLIIGHIIGTVLGVGGGTFIEIHLNMALADGKMDGPERAVMGKDFFLVRIGLAISILTGLGFVWLAFAGGAFGRLDGVFWSKMAIIVILVVNAVLLHKHKIGLYWGSALSLVSWWAAMLLGIFLTYGFKILPADKLLSFASIMVAYGLIVCVGAWVLHKIREYTKSKYVPPAPPAPPASTPPVVPAH